MLFNNCYTLYQLNYLISIFLEAISSHLPKSLLVASFFSILKKELPLVVLFEQKKIVATSKGFSFLSGLNHENNSIEIFYINQIILRTFVA